MVPSAVTHQCVEGVVVPQRAKLASSVTTFTFSLSQSLFRELYQVVKVSVHDTKVKLCIYQHLL